jgi:hypothetical protein
MKTQEHRKADTVSIRPQEGTGKERTEMQRQTADVECKSCRKQAAEEVNQAVNRWRMRRCGWPTRAEMERYEACGL